MSTRPQAEPPGIAPYPWILATLVFSAVALGVLMWFTSGDVPRADEWDTPGAFLLARAHGTATFANLFRQHNESRVIFAQLLAAFISDHWGWNQHIFHALNWAITVLTAFLFARLVANTFPNNQRLSRPAVLVLCSATALVFTPVQWRNLLSSGQIVTISIPLLLIAGVTVNLKQDLPAWLRYLCAAAFSLVASFSFVNGLMLWFLLWPAPLVMLKSGTWRLRRSEILATIAYGAVAFAVIALYFVDYHRPPSHPALSSGLVAPHRTFFFASTWLAGPLFPEHLQPWAHEPFVPFYVCSALAALTGLLFALYLQRKWRTLLLPDVLLQAFPYGILLVYSLASASSIAVARVGLGMFGNLSRYSTVAMPAYLGVAGMVALASISKRSSASKPMLAALSATFALAVVAGACVGSMGCLLDKQSSRQAKLSLSFQTISPDDPLFFNVFPSHEYFAKRADGLQELGILPTFPSYEWMTQVPPATRTDIGYRVLVEEAAGQTLLNGNISPSAELESEDVLLLWNLASDRPTTAFLAPSGKNYPLKHDGIFEVRLDPSATQGFSLARHELRLARPRTREVWRLTAQESNL